MPKDHEEPQLPPPNADFYDFRSAISEDERAILDRVRAFAEAEVAPIIEKYWADGAFPFSLIPKIRELGIVGVGYQGFGCAGGSTLLSGFIALELEGEQAEVHRVIDYLRGQGVRLEEGLGGNER